MSDNCQERAEPAPYPSSDKAENNAVDTLNYILDERVKSHIDTRDKVPNHDGYLELVDENEVPLGRINVQVKKLPDKNRDSPKKQMKTKHLSYCYVSNDPFVVILVDIDKDIAYWAPITEEWYEKENLHNQKSSVIKFPEQNQIRKNRGDYVNKWLQLITITEDSFIKLDKPKKGVVNWDYRLNQNFAEIDDCITYIGSELGISSVGDYEPPDTGQKDWHIPLNKIFLKIENDVQLLAKEIDVEDVGSYHIPEKGEKDWHISLNHNFYAIEEDIERIAKTM